MPENQNIGEMRKQKLKEWLKDPSNFALIGILIFAFIIRLYYFFLTKNQPLWWDESEYAAYAKALVGKADYTLGGQRLPGFPAFLSVFFLLGMSEPLIRFFALFIPSIIVIVLTYFCVKEMYPDKRIALISTAIIVVLWEHLFYSNRFHTENLALIFQFVAIFILFRVYINKKDFGFIKSNKSILTLTIIFISSLIAFIFRPGNLLFIPALVLFLLLYNKNKLLKPKNLLILGVLIGLAILSFTFFPQDKKLGLLSYYHPENPLAWNVLGVFQGFYQSIVPKIPSVLLYAFLLGILIAIIDMFIFSNEIKNIEKDSNNLAIKSDVFNFILLVVVLGLFIFVIRPYTGYEYRWFFPFLPAMLVFTSKGIINFSSYISLIIKSKKIILILILLILLLGLYTQWYHADKIVKIKLNSYAEVRDAALWMKERSDKNDIIFSISHPQTSYYSERKVISYSLVQNDSDLDNLIKEYKPKYLTISVFEQHPKWVYDWPQRHNETVRPVQVYYLNKEQKQPVLIVYEFKN